MMEIRLAVPGDAEQIQKIYADSVEHTAFTFETVAPSVADMKTRIERILTLFPWLVMIEGAQILGYAYAGPHRDRAAYRWSVDISVYVRNDQHRKGIGSMLYERLLPILRRQGFYNVYAGITLPNDGSMALHRKFKFDSVGVYQNVGYKLNAWHDVIWLCLQLNRPDGEPKEPIAFSKLAAAKPTA